MKTPELTKTLEETYLAIKAGCKNVHEIKEYMGIRTGAARERASKLREKGLVLAKRPESNSQSVPFTYSIIEGVQYVVVKACVNTKYKTRDRRLLTGKESKYANEDHFNCLNKFLYPKALAKELNK